jgi:D-alanyl-D-alanine dipeptidase
VIPIRPGRNFYPLRMTVLIADPQVLSIPVLDNEEPLVDLTDFALLYAGSPEGTARPRGDDLGGLVRQGVAERLVIADGALPPGIRLLVAEGLRSARAQAVVIAGYVRELRDSFPELPDAEIRRLSTRFVAPLETAPHVAGAAVDLTLADARGQQLWMGTVIDATPEMSDGACAFGATNIDAEARRHRALLADALSLAGLVNYPTEWWHWSYGDRYWAYLTGAERACYGPVDLESGADLESGSSGVVLDLDSGRAVVRES